MTTGSFWNVDNPLKPVGLFDPDSVLDLPFDWVAWLAEEGTTYASHEIVCDPNLECVASAHSLGIIRARIQKASAGVLVAGQKYVVTCRITDSIGQVEDQTGYLKIFEK